jgi:hypothetical protein
VRIDFCEADVLDVFDEWRRAVGVATVDPEEAPRERHESLPAHLDRVVARLTALRSGSDRSLHAVVASVVGELDAARATAKNLRGAARTEFLARLSELDARLMAAARDRLTIDEREDLRREAEAELSAFRARMPEAAYEQSLAACMDRLLREQARLPIVTLA